ncbi:MAG: TolC family protein [Melioribacteraceae bacterium]
MKKTFLVFFVLLANVFAQGEILENYIKIGIENNLSLKQKQFSLEQSVTELDEARGMFFPTIDIAARYSRAGGGRDIIFPVGDLFNPIYRTLNTFHSTLFPTDLENEVIPFVREKEHDTKVSLILPIIQPALFYNYSIKSNLIEIKEAEKNVYVRSLISEIKISYFNYWKSKQVVNLYSNTIDLVKENLRVSKSLFRNDKVTVDVVHRAKAELSEVEQKQIEADRNVELAKSYFNFLLNKPLDSEIEKSNNNEQSLVIKDLPELEELAIINREEFSQLEVANKVAEKSKGLAQSNYYPGLVLAVDYGFQGEKYKFGKDDDYWMASLVLNWNLFNGFQDNAKAEKAELEAKKLSAQILEIKNRVKLQVREAYKNLIVAEKTIQSTKERLESYKNSFRILSRKFTEGMASQIEYLDARNKLTQAEVLAIIAQYDYKQKIAELEQIVALIDLKKYE